MRLAYTDDCAALYVGDCFTWLRRQAERSIDAVVTDPPYAVVEYQAEELAKREHNRGVWRIPPSFDGWTRQPLPRFTDLSPAALDALDRFYERLATALRPVLKPGAHVFVASTPVLSYRVAAAFTQAGLERRGEIVRITSSFRGGDRPKGAEREFSDVSVIPRGAWEPWLLFREPLDGTIARNLRRWGTGALRRPADGVPFTDVLACGRPTPDERALSSHPSLKPQAFVRRVVRASLPLGTGVVLDPFAGSGSTLAAATAVGYASVGVEVNPTFANEAARAIPRLATLQPVAHPAQPLESDDQVFAVAS